MQFIRGNTARSVKIGPFLDSTNGNDNETALTISQADIRLSKNDGDFAQKNDTGAATHDELGMYDCPLNTTDTNTYGSLLVAIHEGGALLVKQLFMVLPEIIYDSFFPSAAGAPLPVFGILDWGTAQAGAADSLQHRSGLSLANNIPNGATDLIYSGTGAGQSRVGHAFDGATDTLSVSPAWTTTPDNTSQYVTFGGAPAPTHADALPTANIPDAGLTAAKFAANAITAAATAADFITEVQNGLATAAALDAVDNLLDTEMPALTAAVAGITTVTDNLATAMEADGGVYRFTVNALEQAPAGGGGVADWNADERTAIRAILGIPASGTTPEDPTAGVLDIIRDLVVVADAAIDNVQADTNDIQSRLPAALVSGRMDASIGATQANAINAAGLAADVTTELQAGLATAAALDVVDNLLDTEMPALTAAVAAIQAKTNSLTFTVAGRVDSNMMSANSSDLTGNGTTTPISAV